MAQVAKSEIEKTVIVAKDATDKAADITREVAGNGEDVARRGFEIVQQTLEVAPVVARRSAEGTAEFGQVFAELANEQSRHSMELFKALTGTVDWDKVAQIHSEFLRASLERAAQLTQRYFEVVQAVLTTTASAAKEEAKKAA
jgi:hypothetical protein